MKSPQSRASLVLLLLAGAIPTAYAQITIFGNENPLIIGVPQVFTCIADGVDLNVVSIQWALMLGNFGVPLRTDTSGATELTWELTPVPDTDGTRLKCVVTVRGGSIYEQEMVISVKELEHSLNITATTANPVDAGTSLTLECVAVSDRVPHLHWLGPNGDLIESGVGISVLEVEISAMSSRITLTFNPLLTSHRGSYVCMCETQNPRSVVSTPYLLTVKIPPPIVTITRLPASPTRLYTGDSLTLTCVIKLHSTVDTPISTHTSWSGNAALSDSPRVTVTAASSSPPYNSLVTFSSLKSSDTGNYVCSAQVLPQVIPNQVPYIVESTIVNHSINIAASLRVKISIAYDPPSDYDFATPPYYRPCTSVTLTCMASGATGEVSYSWTSTNTNSFFHGKTDKSVTATMLTASDGGLHKCCATDADGNSGCAKTEMAMKGMGIFIDDSQYSNGIGVPDNSIVVPKSASCTNCKLDIFCCSDISSGTAQLVFPDGVMKESSSDYNNIVVQQLSGTVGLRAYNYKSYYPQRYGLYCCSAPSLGEDILTSSVAVYASLPGPPRVYYSSYHDLSMESSGDEILNITCSTSDSPPTTVEWTCDGETVDSNGIDFEAVTVVTDKRNLYYDNILYVKNATFVAGKHNYECKVENSQGNDTHRVATSIPVYEETKITASGALEHGNDITLTCSVKLRGKLNQLLQYMKLEWLGPFGVPLTARNNVHIGLQTYSEDGTAITLTFNPLSTDHSGLYRCVVSITIPSLFTYFNREIRFPCIVISRALFQLRFGPVAHCSQWYEDLNISERLESDLKTALAAAINDRCRCNFPEAAIDLGEFSCQTTHLAVVYRAQITGTVYTSSQLLALINDWVMSDGTFLYTYHGRIRLILDPNCPLEIPSFSQVECGVSKEVILGGLFSPLPGPVVV